MRNENGITLSSLLLYVIVMIMVVGVMSSVSSMFYNNINNLDGRTDEISKFNNFNNYFVKEIKTPNNAIDRIADDNSYILFKSGNSFSFRNNSIYYNDLNIANNVNNVTFTYYDDVNINKNHDIVTVNVEFEKYSKQISYKVESIY